MELVNLAIMAVLNMCKQNTIMTKKNISLSVTALNVPVRALA